ncbi:hypothetical protein [Archangium sp.]|uniref:hypothetical protein n=1 Tax=Archangium sp. TaxID=1872627 RepID=UPI002D7273E1|nr:hypothetical protein [Archangium sp.]HYO53903.1 hypothetical protein [Archangium sp.]
MSHWFRVAALVALSLVLSGSRCGEDEGVTLEVLRQDVAPPFDYSLYSDAQGRLTGKNSDVLLVYRSAHLERVYADAQQGDTRARALFGQLEAQAAASGHVVADQALGLVCTSLPNCTVRWQFLDELIPSREAGGMRLRHVFATSFERKARLKGVENAVITAVLSVLLVGAVVEMAEVRAAGTEARAGAVQGRKLVGSAGLAEGLSLEEAAALEARMAEAEALEVGARLPAQLEVLARHRPSVNQPPRGVAADSVRWVDYVAYWERRYEELAGTRQRPVGAPPAKPPLAWDGYNTFLGRFQRALDFQRDVARALRREAGLAKGERHLLRGLEQPLVAENVGLAHEGHAALTYVDQLVLDEVSLRPGQPPVVHSFSNKQRDFKSLSKKETESQLDADMQEALTKYGSTVEIRRPGHPLFGRKVTVSRVHLVYDEQGIPSTAREALAIRARKSNIELHFHAQE